MNNSRYLQRYPDSGTYQTIVSVLQRAIRENTRNMDALSRIIDSIEETNYDLTRELNAIMSPPRQLLSRRRNPEFVTTIASANTGGMTAVGGITALLQDFLRPVEIHPTPAQIEIATQRIRFADLTNPLNTSCPISMEEFDANDVVTVVRHCGHIFHSESLINWFRTSCVCPTCRYDIRTYVPPNNIGTNDRRSSQWGSMNAPPSTSSSSAAAASTTVSNANETNIPASTNANANATRQTLHVVEDIGLPSSSTTPVTVTPTSILLTTGEMDFDIDNMRQLLNLFMSQPTTDTSDM